jgi:glycosyltransferase involved in cell wall biosynthesis
MGVMNNGVKIAVAEIRVSRTYRGTEKYVSELCRVLKAREHKPAIITLRNGPMATFGRENGIPVAMLPIRGDLNPLTPGLVSGALRKLDVELVNTHGSHGAFLSCLGARLAGIRAIHTVHGLDNRVAGLAATHLIAVSDCVKQHLIRLGLQPERITVVPTGVDIDWFTPGNRDQARAEMELDPDWFCFAVIAMFQKRKGLPFLLDTFRQVIDSTPYARLLIVGSGSLEGELRAQVDRLGMGSFVRFLGFQADVRPVLAASNCLVLASECEGLPLVLLEAMACGRATVATDVGGSREIVREGKTGILVPSRAGEALLNAMLYAAQNPEWTREAGLAARSCVEKDHSIEKQVDGIEDVYYRVIRKR